MTPMKDYEYMRLRLNLIPDKIIHQYNFRDLADEQGWVYVEIQMGMLAFPRLASLPTNYSNNASTQRGTTVANTHLAYGATYGETSASVL
jgi:hypothetical protein